MGLRGHGKCRRGTGHALRQPSQLGNPQEERFRMPAADTGPSPAAGVDARSPPALPWPLRWRFSGVGAESLRVRPEGVAQRLRTSVTGRSSIRRLEDVEFVVDLHDLPPHFWHSSGSSSPIRGMSLAQAIRQVSCEPGFAFVSQQPSAACPPAASSAILPGLLDLWTAAAVGSKRWRSGRGLRGRIAPRRFTPRIPAPA